MRHQHARPGEQLAGTTDGDLWLRCWAIEQAIQVTGQGRTLGMVLSTAEKLRNYVLNGPETITSDE